MAFKLNDLIIGLLPPAEAGPRIGADCTRTAGDFAARMLFCRTVSPPVIVLPDCAQTVECALTADRAQAAGCVRTAPIAAEAVCTITAPGESAQGLQDLAALKQQLQQALAQVEEQERALAASQLPQTLAEAEDLEAKLRGALEELQRHKETLKG